MLTPPCNRINGKSVKALSEKVETSTALIFTSQELISIVKFYKQRNYLIRPVCIIKSKNYIYPAFWYSLGGES
jgi:hypothetical protein